jgi:hypothetical protein
LRIFADVIDKYQEYLAMITVSASLFQSQTQFRADRESAIQPHIRGGNSSGSDHSSHGSLMQSLKENMGLELRPEQTVKKALFDGEAIMDTVLKHVNKRIEQAAANGASDDELKSMVEAARSGVETGFSQAREQIESAGKLSSELSEKIDSAETGIYEGIDDIAKALFPVPGSDDSVEDSDNNVVSQQASSVSTFEQSYERQKNNFSFELFTQEGDKVTITAMTDLETQKQSYNSDNGQQSISAQSFAENYSSGYSFNVEGDLNDAEMSAIEDLVGQVYGLAKEFYDGDLSTAFDMALELESDGDQIAQFSLNLRQEQVSAYQFTGAADYGKSDALPRGLMAPLGQFASGLQDAKEVANQFQQPRELLENLFKQMDDNPKLHDLLRPMLDKMAA